MTPNSYCGINLLTYDYYQEVRPKEHPLDASKYNQLHFEFKSDPKGQFEISINQDSDHLSRNFFDYSSNDFQSYNLPLTSFEPPAQRIKPADLSKINVIGFLPHFNTPARYTIRNVYFYNSKTKESYRIAGIYSYTWKSNDSLKVEKSAKIIEAELAYDPNSNVTGLEIILNSNPNDYHSTVDLTVFRTLILDLKTDNAAEINLTLDGGTPCRLTGIKNQYATFSIPLDKLHRPGVDLAQARELKLMPVTSVSGKLYVRNIRFE